MLACLLALACSHVDTLCPVQWQQLVRTHEAKDNRKRESCSFLYAGATHALLCRSARLCFSSSWLILTRRFFYPHHHHHFPSLPLVNHRKQGVGVCDEQRIRVLRACCIGCGTWLLLLPAVHHGPLQCLCRRLRCAFGARDPEISLRWRLASVCG